MELAVAFGLRLGYSRHSQRECGRNLARPPDALTCARSQE
jgi:hypothetical protein